MDTLTLIAAAQTGDDLAMERLLRIIRDEHMAQRVAKFRRKNVLIDDDELESEFLIGCYKAVPQAKLDVGNPLMFILWKGENAVAYIRRKRIREGVRVNCHVCGIRPLNMRKGRACCPNCGSFDVSTYMVLLDESQQGEYFEENGDRAHWDTTDPTEVATEIDDLFNAITYDIQVEEIRTRLSGRVLQLFDKIVVEQINRDTSKNYLQEIATEWGVTTACLSIYLRKLKIAVLMYYHPEG